MNFPKLTKRAYIWTRILGVPFWGLVNLMPIILYKDLHVSSVLITLLIALKPISALLAPYWSQLAHCHKGVVSNHLAWANFFRYLPFIFVPFYSPFWMVTAFATYMILTRGVIPGWMEMVKSHLSSCECERLVAYGSTIDYCGAAFLPLLIGWVLDGYLQSWVWMFPITALIGMLSTPLITRIPASKPKVVDHPTYLFLLKPWMESFYLLRKREDFARFQIGFMLSGAGIMMMQPMLPIYFVDVLSLSYTKMLVAVTACKAVGFLLTSPIWLTLFRRISIHCFSAFVTAGAALFPLLLFSSQFHIWWFYLAYGLYGMVQAGSELSWHMSGPRFAQGEDSTLFSNTNILMVGVRGAFAPLLGALIYFYTNSSCAIFLCAALCLLATYQLVPRTHRLKTKLSLFG